MPHSEIGWDQFVDSSKKKHGHKLGLLARRPGFLWMFFGVRSGGWRARDATWILTRVASSEGSPMSVCEVAEQSFHLKE